MMRSMYSAVTGLRNHLMRMDAIGNNIANVNTPAYKSSRVTFKEALYETLRGGSAPEEHAGGTNPQQIGLGSTLGSIEVLHGQGAIEYTGNMTDFAVDGAGFFIVRTPTGLAYARAGNFSIDPLGNLVSQDGYHVLGWLASDGEIRDTSEDALAPLSVPLHSTIGAKATEKLAWAGNLDANVAVGDAVRHAAYLHDSLGGSCLLTFEFVKTADNAWTCSLIRVGDQDLSAPLPAADLVFNADGTFSAATVSVPFEIDGTVLGGANDIALAVDFSGLLQYKTEGSLTADADGHAPGALDTFVVDDKGVITGVFSNGQTRPLGRIALAGFANPSGLVKLGGSLFGEGASSGARTIAVPGAAGLGSIIPSSLEMSDVDLAQEFTTMLITQRGFQANSRVIGASDEMLREIVGLGR